MTTLKNLKGTAIQFLDADPVEYVGTWSSGGTLNTTRQQSANGTTGIQTAAVATGGAASSTHYGQTEQYNGSAWSEVNDLNTARKGLASCATSNTALVVAGGNTPTTLANTESFNGSSWSEVNDLNTARQQFAGAGTQTAGLVFGGNPGSTAVTESWDGSSWTEVNDLNEAVGGNSGGGSQTAGFMVYHNQHEQWNGSSWTETTELNTSRTHMASVGTTTATLTFGGENPGGSARLANTESWNGSVWTEGNDLSTGTYFNSGSGTNTLALNFTGDPGPGAGTNTSEEWSFPSPTATIVQEGDMWFNSTSSTLKGYGRGAAPIGTWAAGGNLNTARGNLGHSGSGTQTASIVYGGNIPPGGATTLNENYDGTSWTEVGDLPAVRDQMISFGTSTAAIAADGTSDNGTTFITSTTSWNGTTWTDVPATVNTNLRQRGSAGVQTAGLGAAGVTYPGANNVSNELWDGSSWTEVNNVNTGGQQRRGAGTQTAAILVSVYPNSGIHEQWDGTSWTETTDLNTARAYASTSGSQTNALAFGGNQPKKTNTEHWNGTTWTEVNDLGTGISEHSATGSASSALSIGGNRPGYTTATEEFTAPNAVLTVTTS